MPTSNSTKPEQIPLLADALIATVRQPLVILDSQLRVLMANKSFYQMFHISTVETVGRVLFDLGNGQWNIAALRTLLENILPEKQEVEDFEVRHSFPVIGERVMILNARTLTQRPGETPLIFLSIEDATTRLGKARDLEVSRDFAEGIIETLRDPMLVMDANLTVVKASNAFYEVFRCQAKETEGRKIYDLNNRGWDIPELRTLLEDTLLKSSSFRDFELNHSFHGIGRRDFLLNGRRVFEKNEKTERILLVIEDVTARRQQEKAIRFQAEALNRVNDAVIAVNNEGGLTYWNSRAEILLKIPTRTPEGVRLNELCQRIRTDSPAALFAVSTEQTPWREYRVLINDSHEEHYLESSASYNYEADGSVAGRLVVIRDVTSRKRADIALKRMNQDLELFTSIASHDLQEPLRTVSMYMQLLAKAYQGKLGQDADEYIGFAVDGTKRMTALLEDLIKYALVPGGIENFRRIPLQRVLDNVTHDLQVAIGETHTAVEHLELPEVFADEAQMRQVFQNLIGNAMKYRSPNRVPIINVAAEKKSGEWLISVKDNGTGFDMAHAQRVFKLFQRLENQAATSGTGLGLTITKKIVEAHAGRIWVESAPNVGSTFFFTLPC